MEDSSFYPAAVKKPKSLAQLLCDNFTYQKLLALERAGVSDVRLPKLSEEKAWALYGEAMTKMASLIEPWMTDPAVLMEACFSYSRSKRHMDGPQLNMLSSHKYLMQAMAYYLELPKGAVIDMLSVEAITARLAKDAALSEASIRQFLKLRCGSDDKSLLLDSSNVDALVSMTSVPPLHRFLFNTLSMTLARALIPDVLADMRDDAKQRLWAKHNGWTYNGMATYYHVITG
jgi:hypothetical protein